MTRTEQPLRIALVGGGIAGLACAVGILKAQKEGANIRLDIYEQAGKFAEIGAGVSFGSNAERALRLLGAGDALDTAAGVKDPEKNVWFDFFIAERSHARSKQFVCQVKDSDAAQGSINVHRADFLDQLIALIPVDEIAHFHHRAISYTPHETGITLHFNGDKPDREADVVIASDGIKSPLRQRLFEKRGLDVPSQVAKYSEWIAWRGLIPRVKFEEVFGKEQNIKSMHLGQGRHILHFPVRSAQFINIVAFVRDPDHVKLGDKTGPWQEERPSAEMLLDFAGFTEECQNLLRAIEKPSIWGIFALPEIDEILDDRIVLIGDAAHATTPHQGSGAGQAVEDALFISSILTHPSLTSLPSASRATAINSALTTYKAARHARGVRVQKTSREAGMLYEFFGVDGEGDDLDKIKASLEHRLKWIWEWDTKGELEKVLATL